MEPAALLITVTQEPATCPVPTLNVTNPHCILISGAEVAQPVWRVDFGVDGPRLGSR